MARLVQTHESPESLSIDIHTRGDAVRPFAAKLPPNALREELIYLGFFTDGMEGGFQVKLSCYLTPSDARAMLHALQSALADLATHPPLKDLSASSLKANGLDLSGQGYSDSDGD